MLNTLVLCKHRGLTGFPSREETSTTQLWYIIYQLKVYYDDGFNIIITQSPGTRKTWYINRRPLRQRAITVITEAEDHYYEVQILDNLVVSKILFVEIKVSMKIRRFN